MRFDGFTHQLTNTTALRLLPKLPILLSTREALRVDQRALAGLLGVSQPAVSRGLGALAAVGTITREGRGPGSRYRLSREVDWPEVIPASFHNPTSAAETDSLRSPWPAVASTPPPRARTVPATAAAARAELLRLRARHVGAQARVNSIAELPEHARPREVFHEAIRTMDNLAAEIVDMRRRIRSLARSEGRARRTAQAQESAA